MDFILHPLAFFDYHVTIFEFLIRFVFGMAGGYIAWAWIFKIQNGENDTTEKPDSYELLNRMLVGGFLGIMFGEMMSVLSDLNVNGTNLKFLDQCTWVVAGFIGIMGKQFVKKFLTMLGEDVFDFHSRHKDAMLNGDVPVSYTPPPEAPPRSTPPPVEPRANPPENHAPVLPATPAPIIVPPAPFVAYSQKNPLWGNLKMPNGPDTYKQSACLLSCLATFIQKTPLEVGTANADMFNSKSEINSVPMLLGRYGMTIEAVDVVGGTQPNKLCIARTSYYADKHIPTHFYLAYPDNTCLDPNDMFPVRKPNPYINTTNQFRFIKGGKI
jgi:hypothetical protein